MALIMQFKENNNDGWLLRLGPDRKKTTICDKNIR
jgi:hypothetical protein